ncbi:M48 family metallopeptidase [Saccharothrix deserti]|uniref:M48 family metallopeptidase n=1 Tax=Saccharothrix deserti TaxID=2593674 RepID=UPI00131E0B8A|nr:M48 family metallopeptidase [Saccharothrix deserti]
MIVLAVLALALLVGLYLLVVGIVVFYVQLCALALLTPVRSALEWEDYAQLAAFGAAIVVMLRGMVSASGSRAVLPGSVTVSPEQAPGLWSVVREVADRFGTATPVEIRLTAEPNAAVNEEARMLGLLPGRRRLYVGVPLLLGLTTDEVRAVLCHEFGHYVRGHTRLGSITYRGHTALVGARRELADSVRGNDFLRWSAGFLVWGLLSAYGRLYDLISLAVRRRQEIDADLAAARIAGPAVLADALRAADATAAAWADFRTRFVEPMERLRVIPNEVFSPFRAILDNSGYRAVIARRREHPPVDVGRRDSHPALRQRLALLQRLTEEPRPVEGAPAELLSDPTSLFVRVTPPNSRPGKPVPWQAWLELLAEHDAAAAAMALPVDPVTCEAVFALLAEGPHPAARFDAVYAVVGQALVTAGVAAWTVPWTSSRALVFADGSPDVITDLVRDAIDRPDAVDRLRSALLTAGADLALAVAQREKPKGLLDIAYQDGQ